MALDFRPTIKTINIASEDLTKITLEVKNGSLDGKFDELRKFSGQTVNLSIVPQSYAYTIPFDKSTNAPTQEYVVNNDGTIDFVKKEQTQLEIDDQGNIDIEDREFQVTKEVVDEFILAAKSLEFPGNINPRDVLTRQNDGESMEEIAESYEMSEINVVNELERARAYYAPYAAAWDKKRNEVIFQEKNENAENRNETDDFENETDENDTDLSKTEENVTDGTEVDNNEPEPEDGENEADPY